ncbi:MAG: VOC family protein, partial [Chitinophagaceae bacterium]
NALISLGNKTYLEIIAPDPDAANLQSDYTFLREFKNPELFYWAVRTENMDILLKNLEEAGYKNSGIHPGSRQRQDGTVLKWRSLSVEAAIANDVVPFFIEWDQSSKHPSVDAPKGCTIESFEINYSEPDQLKKFFRQLNIQVSVKGGAKTTLQLKIKTPKGIVLL